jgi:hypothetical protein
MSPFQTTNNYLAAAIKADAASERLLDLFSLLPEKAPIAVVYREEEETDTFIAFAVTYFAWPRPVQSFPVRRDNAARQLQALAAAPVSASFFCGVLPPPDTERLIRIGDGLAVAPRTTR